MNCPKNEKLNEYIEGEINPIESSIIKDHLILCSECNKNYQELKKIEDSLLKPILNDVPKRIEKFVMRKIKMEVSYYSSISALVIAAFLFLITSFYVIFDFANNSLIRSFGNVSSSSAGIVSNVINFISGTFKLLYSILSSCNTLMKTVFNINTGIEFLAITSFCISIILIYIIYSKVNKRKQQQ